MARNMRRSLSIRPPAAREYNWEDLAGLGDSDFNDAVLTVHLAGQSSRPPATLHAPGTGNKTVTLNGTLTPANQPQHYRGRFGSVFRR